MYIKTKKFLLRSLNFNRLGFGQKYQGMIPSCPVPLLPNTRRRNGMYQILCLLRTTELSNPSLAFSAPGFQKLVSTNETSTWLSRGDLVENQVYSMPFKLLWTNVMKVQDRPRPHIIQGSSGEVTPDNTEEANETLNFFNKRVHINYLSLPLL